MTFELPGGRTGVEIFRFRIDEVNTHCQGMNDDLPSAPLIRPRPLELRRAVFAVMLRSRTALTLSEIVHGLWAEERIDVAWLESASRSARQQLADLLRWQVRVGRVERVDRATYGVLPDAMSASTRWRCLNWRQIRSLEVRGR